MNPQQSPRKAMICPECQKRHFGDLSWKCPEHDKAIWQPDNRYFGKLPVLREDV